MTNIVDDLRGTLTGHANDDEMWERVIREREEAADEITRLRVENIQMQAALGYGILAEDERHIIPANPYKCGTCDASKHLRAENARLRKAIKRAIRQHEEGNKGLSHRTLCEAVYGEQA